MKRIFSRWSNFFSILSKLSTGEMLNVVSIFFSEAHTKKENEEKTAWKISSRLSTRAMMMTTMNDKKDDDDVDEWRREKLISLI